MDIPRTSLNIPYLTSEQMVEVDRVMIQDYKIEMIQMMENAGRNLAHLARVRFLDGEPNRNKIVVLAGTGGNGGGALACARRLHNWGAEVQVFLSRSEENFTPIPAHQLDILKRMNVDVRSSQEIIYAEPSDLIIDGLIGYSLKGAPRGTVANLIRWSNDQPVPILALDVPSGMDTTTGTVFDPVVRAIATMTLALPKEGLRASGIQGIVGELYLADISVPPELYEQILPGHNVRTMFAESDIIRLW